MPDQTLPTNPLDHLETAADFQRRMVLGVLESYNGNYDLLAELVQNAVDAVEEAAAKDLGGPYKVTVRIDLGENSISVQDTGIGMARAQAVAAFAPNVSFKAGQDLSGGRSTMRYRGYKGVGLTFVAYGTDEVRLHTKAQGEELTRARMRYGKKWATRQRSEIPLLTNDDDREGLSDSSKRGTYIKVFLSSETRPKRLSALAAEASVWPVILRTRTAIGQVTLHDTPAGNLAVSLTVVDTDGVATEFEVEPAYLFPTEAQREPPFRFLDMQKYYDQHPEKAGIPTTARRQDGLHMTWHSDRIAKQLTAKQQEEYRTELSDYQPALYAFLPHNA